MVRVDYYKDKKKIRIDPESNPELHAWKKKFLGFEDIGVRVDDEKDNYCRTGGYGFTIEFGKDAYSEIVNEKRCTFDPKFSPKVPRNNFLLEHFARLLPELRSMHEHGVGIELKAHRNPDNGLLIRMENRGKTLDLEINPFIKDDYRFNLSKLILRSEGNELDLSHILKGPVEKHFEQEEEERLKPVSGEIIDRSVNNLVKEIRKNLGL